MLAPDVEIQDGKGTIILSSEEGETDEALPRCLSEIGVGHGVQLRADDFLQNYDIIINILHKWAPLIVLKTLGEFSKGEWYNCFAFSALTCLKKNSSKWKTKLVKWDQQKKRRALVVLPLLLTVLDSQFQLPPFGKKLRRLTVLHITACNDWSFVITLAAI